MAARVLTISVSEDVERKIRKLAKEKFGGKKGSIAKVISEAVEKQTVSKEQEELRKKALEMLEKGWDMGKILYKKREELYER